MKLKNNAMTAAVTCVSLFASAAPSNAAVLWADDFSQYSDGGLAHQTANGPATGPPGGTGFPGQWFNVGGGGTVNVTTGVVNGNGDIRRGLSSTLGAQGSTIWLSFDWGQVSSTASYGGLSFFDGDNTTERALIGNTFGANNWSVNGAPTDTGVSNIGMNTGVARITLNPGASDDVIEVWVGATGSPVDVSGPAMATSSDRELAGVSIIRIMGGNDQTFDNLVFGTTMLDVDAIPEPSAALLGALGLLGLLRRRR